MSEKKTLWQRCEALGQFEDFRDEHLDMHFEDERWVIHHDGHPIAFIYEDRMQGSQWLADAIISHIERIRFGTTTDSKTFCQQDLNRAGITNVCRPIPDQLPDVTYVVEAPKEEPINGTRYRMCKDQPAQIDCRETKCRFYAGAGTCINVSPALVLHQGSSFWCKSREPKDEAVVEAPKPTEPTQDQLKALTAYVRQNMSSLNKAGFDASERQQVTGGKGVRVHTVGRTKVDFCAVLDELSNGIIEFRCDLPFNDLCKMIGFDATEAIESHDTAKPTQEQLKAIWDHVTHLTMDQETRLGIQYVFVGAAMHAEFQLHIKSVASCKDQWRVIIAQGSNGVFRAIEPFDLALACHRLGCFHVCNSEVVTESPLQFVSIPVTEWQQLREAHKTIQSILFPEIKEVEFEN